MSRPYRVLLVFLVVAYFGTSAFLYGQLGDTQSALERSAKSSAETRVTTVSQRCNFTMLVTNVLVKQDPQVAGPFEQSLSGCLKQLAVVKKIAAAAPTSP